MCLLVALDQWGQVHSIFKFMLETPPSSVTTTSTRSPTSPSAPGNQAAGRRCQRNRGAAWRACRNQQAAASQAYLAEVNSPRPPRPLHHLLTPSVLSICPSSTFAVYCCLRKLPKCPLLVLRLTYFLGVCHLYSLVQDYVVCINNLSKNLLIINIDKKTTLAFQEDQHLSMGPV